MAPALNIAGPDRKYVPRRSDGMVPVMEDGGHSWYGSSWNGVEYPLAYASMSGVICLLLSGLLMSSSTARDLSAETDLDRPAGANAAAFETRHRSRRDCGHMRMIN